MEPMWLSELQSFIPPDNRATFRWLVRMWAKRTDEDRPIILVKQWNDERGEHHGVNFTLWTEDAEGNRIPWFVE